MLGRLFKRSAGAPFSPLLYDLATDMFAIVRHWHPEQAGSARGREFERLFYRYCAFRQFSLIERAGSRTFRTYASASGLQHETDAVIASGGVAVHLELKYLTGLLGKNELLLFNQKGIDLLLGQPANLRSRPMYRMILSGNEISADARVFALQWGIVLVEPDILPLLMVHQLSGHYVPNLRSVAVSLQDELWRVIPKFIVPLQAKLASLEPALQGNLHFPGNELCRQILNKAQAAGDSYWAALDDFESGWLEEHFAKMTDRLLFNRQTANARA